MKVPINNYESIKSQIHFCEERVVTIPVDRNTVQCISFRSAVLSFSMKRLDTTHVTMLQT